MAGRMVKDHWYRISGDVMETREDPCVHGTQIGDPCGRTRDEHVESVGEWMESQHWFIPSRRPSRCLICKKNWRHSTHILLSPKWRKLHRR